MGELLLDFHIFVLVFLGTVFFVIISIRIKKILKYLPIYILIPLGFLFTFLQFLNEIYCIIGNLVFIINLIFLIISLLYEFLHYSKSKSELWHISLLILFFIALATEITSIISIIDFSGVLELNHLVTSLLAVCYLLIPFIIYLEELSNNLRKNLLMEKFKSNMYFELAGDIMIGLDLDGKILLVNKKGCEIFGYKKEELINQDYFKVIIPERIRGRMKKAFNRAINEGLDTNRYYKNEIINKSGEIKLIRWYNAIIYDNNGNAQGMLSSGIDITEQNEVARKLQTSETNFKRIIENTSNIIVVTGYQNDQMYVSPRFNEILGWSCDHPNILFEIMHPDDQDKFMKSYQEAVKNRRSENKEEEIRLKDVNGNYVCFSMVTKDYYDDSGKPIGFITSLLDITERKLAESKLRNTEKFFQNIIENSTDAILVTDFKGKHNYLSPQYPNIIGYDPSEISGIMFELIHPDDRQKILDDFLIAKKEKRAFKPEETILRIKHKAGHYVWVSTISKDYYDENNNVIGIITSMRDITQRKLAEEKQEEAEEHFKQIFESNPAGMHIYDLIDDSKLLFKRANPAADKMFGLNHKMLIDKKIEDAFPELAQLQIVDAFQDSALDRQLIKRDQISYNEHIYEAHTFLISPTSLCVSFIEITERLKAEKELIELNRMKTELLRRASHELKTPLVSIIGSADLLLYSNKNNLNESIEYYLKIIQRGGIRLKKLIESLIDVSQLETNKKIINKTTTNLIKLIVDSIEDVKFLAIDRDININFTEQKPYNINLDNDKIHEVITNLLINAIKYTPPQGRIFININDLDLNFIEISIKDTGIGFTEEEKLQIFKEFGKIERYGQGMLLNTEGIGLGLYITKKIVDLHGGTITVESAGRNKGSNFIVKLPKR